MVPLGLLADGVIIFMVGGLLGAMIGSDTLSKFVNFYIEEKRIAAERKRIAEDRYNQ